MAYYLYEGYDGDYDDHFEQFYRQLEELKRVDDVTKVAVPVVFTPLLLIGLFGNIFVIYVTLTTKRIIQNPVHSMLVLNLAVSDIIYLLSSGPFQVLSFSLDHWIGGKILCPLLHFLSTQTMAVGIFTICSLALMRFLAIRWPFRVKRSFIASSGKLAGYTFIFIIWTLASILALPIAIYYRIIQITYFSSPSESNLTSPNSTSDDVVDKGHQNVYYECKWVAYDKKILHKFNSALLILTYIVPFILVLSSYLFIARIVCAKRRTRTHHRIRNNNNGSLKEVREQSEYARTNAMVFGLVIAFTICWFPHHLYEMLRIFSHDFLSPAGGMILEVVGLCFSYAHACLNPIIYTFVSPSWRQGLTLSLKERNRKRKTHTMMVPYRDYLIRSNWGCTGARSSQETLKMTVFTNQESCCNTRHGSQSQNGSSRPNSNLI